MRKSTRMSSFAFQLVAVLSLKDAHGRVNNHMHVVRQHGGSTIVAWCRSAAQPASPLGSLPPALAGLAATIALSTLAKSEASLSVRKYTARTPCPVVRANAAAALLCLLLCYVCCCCFAVRADHLDRLRPAVLATAEPAFGVQRWCSAQLRILGGVQAF